MTTAAQKHGSEFAEVYLPKTFARGRITTCGDIDLLDTWIRRAVTVSGVDELFA
jgi:hypothetical protein